MRTTDRPLRRGQIWWIDWEPGRGSEQHGRRPSLIIQADEANELDRYGLTIVLTMSTKGHSDNPLHVMVEPSTLNGLSQGGFIKCEQILTVTKKRLDGFVGQLEPRYQRIVDSNLRDVLAL